MYCIADITEGLEWSNWWYCYQLPVKLKNKTVHEWSVKFFSHSKLSWYRN